MKKQGETQGLHPSRDQYNRPTEYENLHGRGSDQIYLTGGGVYEVDELKHAAEFWKEEGAYNDPEVYADARHALEPAQGRLFDPDKHEAANRQKLGRSRLSTLNLDQSGEFQRDEVATDIRNKALQDSTIPTSHLQSRPDLQETRLTSFNEGSPWQGSGAAGWFRGPSSRERSDTIAVDPQSSHGTSDTLIHEMGHRRHLGEPKDVDLVRHPRGTHPDPLKEAVADAYVDRYGGSGSSQVREMSKDIEAGRGKFPSYQYTGYSTNEDSAVLRGWNDTDRALYAATRAHASETGEQPFYTPRGHYAAERPEQVDLPRGNPTSDATLHSLISAGPHAKQALRQTGLKDVGAAAYRRHQDRQLLTQGQEIQGSLLESVHRDGEHVGYVPNLDAMPGSVRENARAYNESVEAFDTPDHLAVPEHMSHNQFGEAPRTTGDVQQSLGVASIYSKKRGFV